MELVLHDGVQALAEFMQGALPATRVVAVPKSVDDRAPLLWGQYPTETIDALQLRAKPIVACAGHIQPSATVSDLVGAGAGDGSAVEIAKRVLLRLHDGIPHTDKYLSAGLDHRAHGVHRNPHL